MLRPYTIYVHKIRTFPWRSPNPFSMRLSGVQFGILGERERERERERETDHIPLASSYVCIHHCEDDKRKTSDAL